MVTRFFSLKCDFGKGQMILNFTEAYRNTYEGYIVFFLSFVYSNAIILSFQFKFNQANLFCLPLVGYEQRLLQSLCLRNLQCKIQLHYVLPKPSRKIESVNKAFLFWYWQRLKKYFFRNETFLFFKIESWNFQNLFEKGFQLNQTTDRKN